MWILNWIFKKKFSLKHFNIYYKDKDESIESLLPVPPYADSLVVLPKLVDSKQITFENIRWTINSLLLKINSLQELQSTKVELDSMFDRRTWQIQAKK